LFTGSSGVIGQVGTLVHVADLHFGAPLELLGVTIGEAGSALIRSETRKAFDRLIELALRVEADTPVLAGAGRSVGARIMILAS